MTVAASQRLSQSRDWSVRRIGQVVTTIIVDQMVAARNGRRIHSEADDEPADDENREDGAGEVVSEVLFHGRVLGIVPLRRAQGFGEAK